MNTPSPDALGKAPAFLVDPFMKIISAVDLTAVSADDVLQVACTSCATIWSDGRGMASVSAIVDDLGISAQEQAFFRILSPVHRAGYQVLAGRALIVFDGEVPAGIAALYRSVAGLQQSVAFITTTQAAQWYAHWYGITIAARSDVGNAVNNHGREVDVDQSAVLHQPKLRPDIV